MKVNTFRNIGTAAVLFGSMGGASLAQAFTLNNALLNPRDSVDVYRLECPAGTVTARANVTDQGGANDQVLLGVAVVRPIATSPENLKADFFMASDGGTSFYADDVPVPGFAETFFVLIVKDKNSNPAGTSEAYESTMRCDDVNGVEIGAVAPTLVQSQ